MTVRREQRRRFLGALATSGMSAVGNMPHAQTVWPTKTIRFVVPLVPGDTSDIVTHKVASELSKQLGVAVIVDNKAGGGGAPAMQEVARAAPDGCTIVLGHACSIAIAAQRANRCRNGLSEF